MKRRSGLCLEQSPCSRTTAPNLLICRRLPSIVGRISAARDDDFMAFPGMEANSTTPPFELIFPDHSFSKQNPVSRAMNTILEMLTDHSMIENERRDLDAFYKTMVERIEAVHTLAGK